MGIFGKKKKEEEEESDSEKDLKEEDKKKVPSKVKRIKDLSPENKKRRREPVRAWNKLDRIILLILILLTFGLSFYFAISAKGFKLPLGFRISIPRINPFSDETIVLTKNRNEEENMNVIDKFIDKTASLSGEYGLYVIRLDSGVSFGLHEGDSFQAASLIKLPVMVGMYMESESGNLSLDTKYKLKSDDRIPGSGSLYKKPVGYELTYREMIKLMGKESDNTAFNICRKYLGDDKIQNIIEEIGMNSTNLSSNKTNPLDIGVFFRKLYNGEIINKKDTEELLGYMTDTIYENWLSEGVPKSVKVAHKYGRETNVVNDAGIVFSKPEYIVVIMSKNADTNQADIIIPEISGIIYKEITGN